MSLILQGTHTILGTLTDAAPIQGVAPQSGELPPLDHSKLTTVAAATAYTVVTDIGEELLGRMDSEEGFAIKLAGFSGGSSGYDPTNPTIALDPSPVLTAVPCQVYPARYAETICAPFSALQHTDNVITCWCRLPWNAASGCIGMVGIWVRISESTTAAELETYHLLAVSTMPMQAKGPDGTFATIVTLTLAEA